MPDIYCTRCGAKLKEGATFCTGCGTKFSIPDPSPAITQPQQPQNITERPKNNPWKIVGIILGSVFGLFILLAIIGSFSEDNTVETIKQSDTEQSAKTTAINIQAKNVELPTLSPGGELIPVLCRYAAANLDTMVLWVLSNTGANSEVVNISAEIPEWSNLAEKTIDIPAGKTLRVPLRLTFKRAFYKNNELVDAQIDYKIKQNDKIIWTDSKPVKIAAKGTMLWTLKNSEDMAPHVAAFVNPHDPKVEEIISLAKERMAGRSLAGYCREDPDAQAVETENEAKAIFGTLGEYGLSYVSSSLDFSKGFTQRVRTPYESITQKSANCIDGAVLYASLFENLGMEPVIILGPGHAFVAVRSSPGSKQLFFIETTMTSQRPKQLGFMEWMMGETPDDPFKRACASGWETFQKWRAADKVTMVDIKEMRKIGILPAFTE